MGQQRREGDIEKMRGSGCEGVVKNGKGPSCEFVLEMGGVRRACGVEEAIRTA